MKTSTFITRFGLTAALVICLMGSLSAQSGQKKNNERPLLPNITFDTIDGQEWSLEKNRGKIIVLNFWATWCAPCRTEIPILVKFADEFEKRGLKVVGVALDKDGTDLVKKFIADYKINYPILIPDADSPFRSIGDLPMTLLIDVEGRMAEKYVGAVPRDVLRKDIESLIRESETHAGRTVTSSTR